MAIRSNIQWTDATWNIARGCTKVDGDCLFCYMYRDSLDGKRYKPKQIVKTKTVFNLPFKIKEPSKIFTSSLTDWGHKKIDSFRHEVFDIIRVNQHHTFQMLTKRTERLPDILPLDWGNGFENVWLGTSVGHQDARHRIDQLCQVPAKVRFLSLEPLWTELTEIIPIDYADGSPMINWIICGGESGNDNGKYRYRECKVEWIESIIAQCRHAGIPVQSGRIGVAQVNFISRYNGVNGGKHDNSQSVENPIGALGCGYNQAKVSATFIDQQFGQGKQNQSVEEPHWGLTCVPKSKIIKADFFLDKAYSGEENHQSIEQPAGSVLPNDKHNLVKAEKWLMNTNFNNVGSSMDEPGPVITADRHHHYLVNPSWGGNNGSIDKPCPVVIARQDKAPLYFVTCTEGPVAVPVYDGDCEWTIKLKEFMALYGISDIKMRMLNVAELKKIQGFPVDYVLLGTQADQKKFIGNSVHPDVVVHWILAMGSKEIRIAA